jgi:chemotaxis protein MotB
MSDEAKTPIIFKRRKGGEEPGHHRGAWKVAYADFVTAMMAFFLLMWLLNATTEQQRKGLADYFAPDIPLARVSGGSDGLFGGDSPASDGPLATEALAMPVEGPPGKASLPAEGGDAEPLRGVEDLLLGRGGESLLPEAALRHVVTRLTDEGLVIEIFSLPGAPLFEGRTARPRAVTRDILAAVAHASGLVTNPVAVAGHLPRAATAGPDPWRLSTARAQSAREALVAGGLDPARLARVVGHADRQPATAEAAALRNDRIEVTLLRRDAATGALAPP